MKHYFNSNYDERIVNYWSLTPVTIVCSIVQSPMREAGIPPRDCKAQNFITFHLVLKIFLWASWKPQPLKIRKIFWRVVSGHWKPKLWTPSLTFKHRQSVEQDRRNPCAQVKSGSVLFWFKFQLSSFTLTSEMTQLAHCTVQSSSFEK